MFNRKSNKNRRRFLRNNMTKAEIILWAKLKSKNLGFKFRRQFGVGPYIIDFYCPKLRFAIELDGDVHAFKSVKYKDQVRQKFLESKNLYIKRYWNSEVLNSCDSVIEDIYDTCWKLAVLKQKKYIEFLESPPKIRGRLQRPALAHFK